MSSRRRKSTIRRPGTMDISRPEGVQQVGGDRVSRKPPLLRDTFPVKRYKRQNVRKMGGHVRPRKP